MYKEGFRSALPIVLGYLPIGIAYGLISVNGGMTIAQTVAMSLIVYAGSAQFIASGMVNAGASPLSIISTVFMVNLRHLLYSASLSTYFKSIPRRLIPMLSFFITDESYGVSITELENGQQPTRAYFLGLFITAYLGWIVSSLIGALSGQAIGGNINLGLDFTLPAMYIALLMMQMKGWRKTVIAVFSGISSVALISIVPGNGNVIISAIAGAALGVLFNRWTKVS
ncbi:MAG: hypothetical protein PWQ93_117 [Clostridiales bacterium]|nr:hypothetical protein [Clostridiales bacterium]